MRGSRGDVAWFAAAVVLLGAGIVGWWRVGTGPALDGVRPGGAAGLMVAVWSSAAVILATWWRRVAAPDAFDARFMGPLALAASAPLSLLPVVESHLVRDAIIGTVAVLSAVPLGWMLGGLLADGSRGWARAAIVLGAAVGVVVVVLGFPMTYPGGAEDIQASVIRWIARSAVTLVPAVMLAVATLRGRSDERVSAGRRLIDAMAVLVVGAAPAVTGLCLLLRDWHALVLPAIAVLITLLVIGRFALQPLAGLAGSAASQRDRVVAAADAERMRLASVLHDGPLADITLLIQRLDDRGDSDSAAAARSIAAELRAIGSELRLPILDDLGTGAALEWLVDRLSGRSGAPIELDHRTVLRPPAEVELAMYRVAQEALVNALKHGSPPVRVGYRATPERAELWVDDFGPGIRPDAPARAEREGRLGLASMAQRAEATGSRLTITARPDGGTRVILAWRAPHVVPTPGLLDVPAVEGSGRVGIAGARP